ncbi:MAG TPA: histidine kinase, partial [Phenylobacterium sp.]
CWTEHGGPAVTRPVRKGFGTSVLERSLGGPIGGTTRLEWRPEGLICELQLPLKPTSEAPPQAVSAE